MESGQPICLRKNVLGRTLVFVFRFPAGYFDSIYPDDFLCLATIHQVGQD